MKTPALLLAAACASAPPAAPTASNKPIGLDLAGMDTSVAPGDDFFAYANGTWIRDVPIPPDRSSWGSAGMLVELTTKRNAELMSANAGQVGDFYASFMDESAIDARGLAPLRPMLDAIAAISDLASLSRALGATVRADVDVINSTQLHTANILGLWVAQDLDDPTSYAAFLLQGGLTMPDRDFYLDASPHMAELRAKLSKHVEAMLSLAGVAGGAAKAAAIVDLETRIARTHVSRADSEDVQKGDNHWTRADLDAKAPGIDWSAFLAAAALDKQPRFVAWQPGAIAGISALVRSQPLQAWKDLLAFHLLDHFAEVLPRAFAEEHFEFAEKALSGTPQMRARWKRAVDATDAALGEAVGKLYVEKYFPASEKARVERMAQNELKAFAARIDKLDWMAPQTRAEAKRKLAALKIGVGYPDKWRDYSGLQIVRGDALGNAERAERFELVRNLRKLGQPVDRGEWVMNPQLVNAVNLPAMNALNFPAAYLQPPNLEPMRPEVMDYGAIGSTIGHEISHSFDDQGALFDSTGRLRNWWTEQDFAKFKDSSERLIKQFDTYQPFPDAHVNGRLTVSENIADVAGLAAAYDAYRLSLGGAEAPAFQGLTGDQQFFLSYAQKWRTKYREALARQRLVTDGHAPPQYRADSVRNEDAWYAAFGVKPGQALWLAPADRVHVW
ncbi:MAG TPA: M13 family metallopeptidase [Myxococcales bacterium]|nr:M13 family metallopeptidase [Myxococcales bacterium]